jgi:hypothetical protein
MEQEELKKLELETKKLLDEFSKALSSVKLSEEEEWNVERDSDRREEGEGVQGDINFRKIMFENASQKDEDFILAEKKTW